ncbi:MAG TPA: acetolactate decarboxylase [Armatimonadota bacterium]|jgi:acetolactate decarboxylase
MRLLKILPAALLLIVVLSGSLLGSTRTVLYQTSAFEALANGVFDGVMTYREVKEHGDFGLGTFNGLAGEMVAVNGKYFQITADGLAHPVDNALRTPFAMVTYFRRDKVTHVDTPLDLAGLQAYVDRQIATPNIYYAVRVEGAFDLVRARSVPTFSKPYPKLSEALTKQKSYELRNVTGVLVGFRCPKYAAGISVPGYHFHFIDASRTHGGHVLDIRAKDVTVTTDPLRDFRLALPEQGDFDRANLGEATHVSGE